MAIDATHQGPSRLVIAGGSGFLGRELIRSARAHYGEIVVLSRQRPEVRDGGRFVQWDARTLGEWQRELDGAAGLVNLVGRTVDCRKTRRNREVILRSRVDSVQVLAAA